MFTARNRLLVGNIGLVLFLAMIFSAVLSGGWPGPSMAQAADSVELLDGTDYVDTAVALEIALEPLALRDFNSVLVQLIFSYDGQGTIGYVYADTYTDVYGTVYAYNTVVNSTYALVYAMPYSPASSYKVVAPTGSWWSASDSGPVLVSVYLDMTKKPPESSGGGGGTGGTVEKSEQPVGTVTSDPATGKETYSVSSDDVTKAANDPTVKEIVISFPAPAAGQAAPKVQTAVFEPAAVEAATANAKPIVIRTSTVVLELPPAAIDAAAVRAAGEGAKVEVSVETVAEDTATQLDAGIPAEEKAETARASQIYELTLTIAVPGAAATEATFRQKVRVGFAYDPGQVPEGEEQYLAVYRYEPGANPPWVVVGRKVDPVTGQAYADLAHFSKYTVMAFKKDFADLATHWSKADVELMAAKRVVKGMTATEFEPELQVTRAQFAVLLQRALLLNAAAPAQATFSDVATGTWYYGAVEAAAAAGLVNGYDDGTFGPNRSITRQEMAVMMARAMGYAGNLPSLSQAAVASTLSQYADRASIGGWAETPLAVAVDSGVIEGRTENSIAPTGNATRAEGTVMLKRLLTFLDEL